MAVLYLSFYLKWWRLIGRSVLACGVVAIFTALGSLSLSEYYEGSYELLDTRTKFVSLPLAYSRGSVVVNIRTIINEVIVCVISVNNIPIHIGDNEEAANQNLCLSGTQHTIKSGDSPITIYYTNTQQNIFDTAQVTLGIFSINNNNIAEITEYRIRSNSVSLWVLCVGGFPQRRLIGALVIIITAIVVSFYSIPRRKKKINRIINNHK